jgi:asparagine synthase (glutamine-hydrolysing)
VTPLVVPGATAGPAPRCRFRFRFREAGSDRTARTLAEAIRGRKVPLDVAALSSRVMYRAPLASRTPYVGVRAEYIRENELGPIRGPRPTTPAEAVHAVRAAMDAAVDHALVGVRRVAVMAGGGLDSSALLALTRQWGRRHGASVFAVALDFGGPGDDRPYMALLERHLGCEVLRVRPEDAARRISSVHAGVDASPFTWPGAPMEVEAMAVARAHGADVLLSGIGGDELFDGDPYALAGMARRDPLGAVRAARTLRGFGPLPRSPIASWIVRPMLLPLVPRSVRAWRAWKLVSNATPAWAGPVLREQLWASELERRATFDVPRFERTWEHPFHEPIAWLTHQEELESGLESRAPFLERSLCDFVATLDPAWLLHGGVRRGLFREAVRDLLPAALVERTDKADFEEAFSRFLAASGGFESLRELASMRELASLGIVDARGFQTAFAAAERRMTDSNFFMVLWPALAVEAFLRGRGAAWS